MFASPVDFLPKSRRDSSKRMGRVYECSKSMIALPAVPVNLTVSEESRRGLPSSPRPPEVLSPLPPPFRSPGLSSSCSNSPIFYSPITPDVNEPATSSPRFRVASANGSSMRRYPGALPSLPSLRASAREKATVRRATTVFDLPAVDLFDLSLPYLLPRSPPAICSSGETVTTQLSRERNGRDSEHRYGLDFKRKRPLAHKSILNEAPVDRRRDSFLPSIHTTELDNVHMDRSTSRTPSSTFSVSLYTSEFDFEFPQPPLSPDLGAYRDRPMFTEEETCQVKKILKKRWGAIDAIERTPPVPAASIRTRTPSPSISRPLLASTSNQSWTECWDGKALGDFSWEACDGSGNTDDKENEGTHNILEKIGLSDNVKDGGRNASSWQADIVTPVSRLPGYSLNVLRPVEEDLGDVSVVLTALRSSIHLDDSAEREKSDDDADRDQALREELRMRMGGKKSPAVVPVSHRCENSIMPVSSPAIVASESPQPRSNSLVLPSPRTPARKAHPTLQTPKPSDDFGEARMVPRYNPGAKHMSDTHGPRSPAFERLESSISKLQMHSPRRPQQSRSYAPSVPPKDIVSSPLSRRNLTRISGVVKKKPTISPPPIEEPQVGSHIPNAHTVPKNLRNKHFHVRSPSAPASVFAPHDVDASLGRDVPPSLSQEKTNVEGFRSFMDMTPVQKPRHTHIRSRSSMASAAFHAEKARKLLARASSSIASWGKGLGWSSSRKA